jgi:hypothetical protein
LFPANIMYLIQFLEQIPRALPTNITLATRHAHHILPILVTWYDVQLMKAYAFVSRYLILLNLNIALNPAIKTSPASVNHILSLSQTRTLHNNRVLTLIGRNVIRFI